MMAGVEAGMDVRRRGRGSGRVEPGSELIRKSQRVKLRVKRVGVGQELG